MGNTNDPTHPTPHKEFSFDDPVLVWLRENTFGYNTMIPTPDGPKKRRYFDFTASGQSFRPIEETIAERVLPFMANTHAESNYSAELMNKLYHPAHQKVRKAMRCTDDDVVIYTGQGSTSAINKFINVLGLRIPDNLQEHYNLAAAIPKDQRPLVIRSRMEHHSNDIPWRETIADIEFIGFDKQGRIDWRALEGILTREEYRNRPLKIGTFSAVSNATGVINEVDNLSAVMHDHGGFACFDYAAGAPYLEIDMHPNNDPRFRKDAVFVSMHKFAGGPQAPGILVCNREMFRTKSAADPGGGTVLFTSPWSHVYLKNLSSREEGGTPQIVQAIRAGLAWDLKQMVGTERIAALEHACITRVAKAWKGHPRIRILGPDPLETPRLGMISMVLDNTQLHYNLAARLLSDKYGIQVRGGCMCAHTYAYELLSITTPIAKFVQGEMLKGNMALKPGWVRVSFGPTVSQEDMDVLVDAIPDLADNWRTYAKDYVLDPKSADVYHKDDKREEPHLTFGGPKHHGHSSSAHASVNGDRAVPVT